MSLFLLYKEKVFILNNDLFHSFFKSRNAMTEKRLEDDLRWGQTLMNTTAWDTQIAQGKNPAYTLDFKVVNILL